MLLMLGLPLSKSVFSRRFLCRSVSGGALSLAVILAGFGFGRPAHAAPSTGAEGRVQSVRLSSDAWRDGGRDEGRYDERQQDHRFSPDALYRLQERIDWAHSRSALSAREANRLQDWAEDLRRRARAYWRSGGLDWHERRELDARFHDLRQEVRHLVWDREYRGPYRQEWRERSLWGENRWRGERGGDDAGLKGSQIEQDDWDADRRDSGRGAPGVAEPPAKQNDAPKNLGPQPRANGTQAPAPNDRLFKDGRDFH
jgi:hypothetical protein